MALWELVPMNVDDPNWETSAVRSRVVIRAATAERARNIAQHAFTKIILHVPGTEMKVTPWEYHELVTCRELVNSDFPAHGDEAILDPAGFDR